MSAIAEGRACSAKIGGEVGRIVTQRLPDRRVVTFSSEKLISYLGSGPRGRRFESSRPDQNNRYGPRLTFMVGRGPFLLVSLDVDLNKTDQSDPQNNHCVCPVAAVAPAPPTSRPLSTRPPTTALPPA